MADTGTSTSIAVIKVAVFPVTRRLRSSRVKRKMDKVTQKIDECWRQVEEAEKRQMKEEAVKKWLGDVKDVYYDMIDEMNEWDTVEMKSQLRRLGLWFLGPLTKCLYYHDFGRRIEKLAGQMERFSWAGKHLKLGENSTEGDRDEEEREERDRFWLKRRVVSSDVVKAKMYGRDDEAEILKSKLISPPQVIHCLSLVGTAGIGRTSVAQTVYNHRDVQGRFDLKMWINVSHDFNLSKIAKIIVQSEPDRASVVPLDKVESKVLLQRLRQIIEGKRFLFVLDDVSNEDEALWQDFREICKHGAPGSAILITTSMDIVAYKAGCKPQDITRLDGLPDEDCWSKIRSKLVEEISPPQFVHYLSLVGIAGIGKTAVAQTAYNDPDVQCRFDLKVWVNVSHDFNLFTIARIIVQSEPDTASVIPLDMVELQFLLQCVRQIIQGKRFLIVLDDVRTEDDALWQEFRGICERGGAPGSMILITTRQETVAHFAGCKPRDIMRLDRLSDQDCWSIIRDFVLNSSKESAFTKVGREIANKCEGLPVVAKSLAGILRSREAMQEWLEVLQIDIRQTSSNHPVDLTPSLMLSYYFLPKELRQCLLYCSIFPKDHIIDVDKLIKLWIAQDYFDTHDPHDKMETKAADCFQELLNRSFFHELKRDDKGNLTCKLVGVISDFIQVFAENECYILHADDKMEFEKKTSRHCTIKVASQASLPGDIGDTKKLHTLMVLAEYSYTDPSTLSNLLSHCRRLRALDLSSCSVRELRIKVGSLLHLRYLDLSFNRDLKKLPKEICDLSFLQTLNLNGCDSLRKLPKGIGKLSNLRHLEILWTKGLSYLPKGIASLTSLQTLNRFFGNDGVDCKACNFEDLSRLNRLQGCISIDGLGASTNVDLARECLKRKEEIRGLDLWFSRVGNDSGVLEALEPPAKLGCLGIHYCRARSFPNWITTLKHRRELKLSYSSESDSDQGNDSDVLEALEPPTKLGCLGIHYCRARSFPSWITTLKHRRELKLSYSRESDSDQGNDSDVLEALEPPSKLECLGIHYYRARSFPNWITTLKHLRELMLSDCSECATLPALWKLIHLEALEIRKMTKLKKLCANFLGIQSEEDELFPKLKRLHLHMLTSWEKWEDMPEERKTLSIMPQLSSVSITSCTKIEALPNYIQNKIKVIPVTVEDCPLLKVDGLQKESQKGI